MFPISKTDYFYLWFLYKSDSRISCFRNDGEMKVSRVHPGGLDLSYLFVCISLSLCTWASLLIKDIKRLWHIHTVHTHIKYAVRFRNTSVLGGFVSWILLFSQKRLLTVKYFSVEDCKSASSCENVIFHTIKEYWILIVTLTANSPFKYFQKSPPECCNIRINLWKWSTWPVHSVHQPSIYYNLVGHIGHATQLTFALK